MFEADRKLFHCIDRWALLVQVSLHNDGSSYQYGDLTIVEGSPVNRDLVFNANRSHLYVMTTDQVRDLLDKRANAYNC